MNSSDNLPSYLLMTNIIAQMSTGGEGVISQQREAQGYTVVGIILANSKPLTYPSGTETYVEVYHQGS